MTVCNMAIEAGARAAWSRSTRHDRLPEGAPDVAQRRRLDRAVAHWRTLRSDPGATFDSVVRIDATRLVPQVTWGTSPEMVVGIEDRVPDPDKEKDAVRREGMERALQYMGLKPNTPIGEIRVDKVFIGSCTNFPDRGPACRRRRRAGPAQGRQREARNGGSGFRAGEAAGRGRGAGQGVPCRRFEWREPGCSMCSR